MKKIYLLIMLLALFTFGLELVSIHLSGKLASNSVLVRNLQKNIENINEKNEILNTKVLELTSFEQISSVAAKMGFLESGKYFSLKNQEKFSYKE